MGITIEGPHKSIDMGYGGFAQLRETVAELTAPDISEHYNYLLKNGFLMSKSDFKKYDAKTEELDRKYGGKFTCILNFLYAADAGASVSSDGQIVQGLLILKKFFWIVLKITAIWNGIKKQGN